MTGPAAARAPAGGKRKPGVRTRRLITRRPRERSALPGKLVVCSFLSPVHILSPFPACSRRGDCAFCVPFHDREEFYIKNRSKVFVIMNPPVLTLIPDVASASADPLPRIPAALHGRGTLSWEFTLYLLRVPVHDDGRC